MKSDKKCYTDRNTRTETDRQTDRQRDRETYSSLYSVDGVFLAGLTGVVVHCFRQSALEAARQLHTTCTNTPHINNNNNIDSLHNVRINDSNVYSFALPRHWISLQRTLRGDDVQYCARLTLNDKQFSTVYVVHCRHGGSYSLGYLAAAIQRVQAPVATVNDKIITGIEY